MSILLALALSAAGHPMLAKADCPSCDLRAQRALAGTVGGPIKDPRQAHIVMRANIVQADIGTARKARRVTAGEARQLWSRAQAVRTATDRFVARQGFLSGAEVASYDRELDAIALRLCRR